MIPVRPARWEATFTVASTDAGIDGTARPSVPFAFAQEICWLQHRFCGPTIEQLRAEGKAFILSRAGMKLFAPLYPGDAVRAVCWAAEPHGYGMERYGELFRGEERIGEMRALWALTDISVPGRRTLLRPSTIALGFDPAPPLDTDLTLRVRFPAGVPVEEAGEHTVLWSECDQNLHMNNTRYPDFFRSFAGDRTGQRVSEFEIAYLNEAPLGMTVRVLRAVAGAETYLRTVRSDGQVGSEARLAFSPL